MSTLAECLSKVYYSIIRTNVGFLVPASLQQCLSLIKIQAILMARSTGDDIDFAYANFAFTCGPNFCQVPPSIVEVLLYWKNRLAE